MKRVSIKVICIDLCSVKHQKGESVVTRLNSRIRFNSPTFNFLSDKSSNVTS